MNILIFYASYGTGHANAASNIFEHISKKYTDSTVEMVDCVKYVNKAIEKVTTKAYKITSENMPWVWGRVYKDANKKSIAHLTSKSNSLFALKLLKLINSQKYDLIISTHPFATQMCSYLKRKNKIDVKLATILTDFELHSQWLIGKEYTDDFFVSNEKMKKSLITNYTIPEDRIHVTGIPISPRFLETYNKEDVLNSLGLLPNKKTVLFFARGAKNILSNKLYSFFSSILLTSKDIQLIVITGKNNEGVYEKFEEIIIENNSTSRVKLLEYSSSIPELMSASDLVISKPGGLTVSESLASNLPILVINPFPGQEEENAEFLELSNVGVWLNKNDNIQSIVYSFLFSDNIIKLLDSNIQSIAKPHATEDICKILLDKKTATDTQ